jgi:anti-sigma B factor antagonist
MTIETLDQAGIKIVRLHGELHGHDGDFVPTVVELFTAPGVRVVIDLTDVPFMNSTGLAELVRVAAQANVQECRLVLAHPNSFVVGVLQTTQLDRFFEVYPSIEAAIAKLT